MLNVPSNLRDACKVSDALCNRETASNGLYGVKISSVNLDLGPISRMSVRRQVVWVVTAEEVSSTVGLFSMTKNNSKCKMINTQQTERQNTARTTENISILGLYKSQSKSLK